jgi:hypothetical protein
VPVGLASRSRVRTLPKVLIVHLYLYRYCRLAIADVAHPGQGWRRCGRRRWPSFSTDTPGPRTRVSRLFASRAPSEPARPTVLKAVRQADVQVSKVIASRSPHGVRPGLTRLHRIGGNSCADMTSGIGPKSQYELCRWPCPTDLPRWGAQSDSRPGRRRIRPVPIAGRRPGPH